MGKLRMICLMAVLVQSGCGSVYDNKSYNYDEVNIHVNKTKVVYDPDSFDHEMHVKHLSWSVEDMLKVMDCSRSNWSPSFDSCKNWPGMTKEMVYEALGEPNYFSETGTENHVLEMFHYRFNGPSNVRGPRSLTLLIDNGIVTSYSYDDYR